MVSTQGESLSALAYMILKAVLNEYVQSVSNTKQSKLKESPEADPRTHVEPAKGFP